MFTTLAFIAVFIGILFVVYHFSCSLGYMFSDYILGKGRDTIGCGKFRKEKMIQEEEISHNCISRMTKRELEGFVQGVGDRNMTNGVRVNIHVYVQIVEPKATSEE